MNLRCQPQYLKVQRKRFSIPSIGDRISAMVEPVTTFFLSFFTKKQMKTCDDQQSLVDQLIELQEYDGFWKLPEDHPHNSNCARFTRYSSLKTFWRNLQPTKQYND